MKTAVYPGSFDPITNGHLDIIKRASRTFDKLIVAVLNNPNKTPMFNIDERVDLIYKCTKDLNNVYVDSFSGLLIDYMNTKKVDVIIKGLRAISDFEYEFQMALMNRKLDSSIETMFMMTNSEYSYLSSSLVKEVHKFGGCIAGLVPQEVKEKMKTQY